MDMRSKYRNVKSQMDGITFDSLKEKARYRELKLLLSGKKIRDLKLQPVYPLQQAFRDKDGQLHREIKYRADFEYYDLKRGIVVEDVKGMKTEVYKIKKKLLLYKNPSINFIEI